MMSNVEKTPEATLKRMNMLVWRMDLSARVFENLNDFSGNVLSRENFRFFKDSEYMKRLLLPEDLPVVTRAVSKIKERMPVQAIFRVYDDGSLHWFKINGWPTDSHKYFEGTVEDITGQINQIRNIFDNQSQRLFSLDDTSYPVAVFSSRNNLMVKCNDSFKDLLGMKPPLKIKYLLSELISSEVKMPALLERLLLAGRVSEELTLVVSKTQRVKVACVLELFSYNTEDLIRFAVVDVIKGRSEASLEKQGNSSVVGRLCGKLRNSATIEEMLSAIYAEQGLFPDMNAAIFSDIFAKRNKVYAYAHGDVLGAMAQGEQFPYSGTIAEHIEKENLEYLIMDDTHASIKAIDWVLFVPNGVRSYIAKALYVRGAMRTVLIMCSKKKQAFSEKQVKDFTEVATTFHQQLKTIKKN